MFQFLKRIASDQKGATAVEYGLIVALIALAMIGAASSLGQENSRFFTIVTQILTDANNAA